MQGSKSESYAKAGVDVTAGYESVEKIKPHVLSTHRPGVLGGLGGFGGLFEPNLSGMKRPVAVSGTDGVGTKLKIAFAMDKHDTIGIDCVAMCVNDIVCAGAEPMFFLDYLAMGKNLPERTEQIVYGVAEGCKTAGCALIGGETAEMPGFYTENEYDIAGFAVGFVDFSSIIDGKNIKPGDIIIALPSSGLHSNGFSLVRQVFKNDMNDINKHIAELGRSLGEELLQPTRIYVKPILNLIQTRKDAVKGICNITGGGLYENVPRMLPGEISAHIDTGKFPELPIFSLIEKKGNIPKRDMYNTFNMGAGLIMAVCEPEAHSVLDTLKAQGENPIVVGECKNGDKGVVLQW